MYDNLSSEELMRLVASGDKGAFACLLTRHRNSVYGIVYRFFKTPEEADDAFQEIFIRVWRSADKYEPTSQFSTWLYKITVNYCKSGLASFWRRNMKLVGSFWLEDEQNFAPMIDSTEKTVSSGQEFNNIRKAVAALPERQRLAIILCSYEGLTYAEIAEVMRCSVASVESMIYRARQNLRKKLDIS